MLDARGGRTGTNMSTNAGAHDAKPTIVLVHGAWADASSWNSVVTALQERGHTVHAPPNTLRGLASDAAVIVGYLETIPGPVVLVGHSYGGSVITVASASTPNVKALVYIDAFVPDAGESVGSLLAGAGTPPPPPDLFLPVPFKSVAGDDVDLYFNPAYYGAVFASGEPAALSSVLAATQRPITNSAITERTPEAVGWKTIPSWYVIGDADLVIPPSLQFFMANRAKSTISHAAGGDHPSMISHPEPTVAAILAAATAVAVA